MTLAPTLQPIAEVAVEVVTKGDETAYAVFVCSDEQWRAYLSPQVAPYELDLKLYDSSAAREKIPAQQNANVRLQREAS